MASLLDDIFDLEYVPKLIYYINDNNVIVE